MITINNQRINNITTLLDNIITGDKFYDYAKRCLLDILGNGYNARQLPVCNIIYEHVRQIYGVDAHHNISLLFTNTPSNYVGAALYAGTLFDALDGHDGHPVVKGHAGAGLVPVLLAFAQGQPMMHGRQFLHYLIIGYEVALRMGLAQHATVNDYHTSGSWNSVAAAIIATYIQGGNANMMRHAAGIAEYYGPRSQMMRAIDYPSNVKDGSAWGAQVGAQAALLAMQGYSGAPSIVLEGDNTHDMWHDIGDYWYFFEQYFKPWPVCRWAQPAIQAWHDITDKPLWHDIAYITIYTFHESLRLQGQHPINTDEAQYAIAFPLAAYIVNGQITVNELSDEGLNNSDILRLSSRIYLKEYDEYNKKFPAIRMSHLLITLHDGRVITTPATESKGSAQYPLSDDDIRNKYALNTFESGDASRALYDAIMTLDSCDTCDVFFAALRNMSR